MSINKKDSTSWSKKIGYLINDIIYVFFKKPKVWEPDTKELSIYVNRSKTRGNVRGQVFGEVMSNKEFNEYRSELIKSDNLSKDLEYIKKLKEKNK